MTIPITPETVQIAKEIVLSGKPFKPFTEFFKISTEVTAKHVLFDQFVMATGCQIPKVFIYIIMDDLFGPPTAKDLNGNFGYYLTFIND